MSSFQFLFCPPLSATFQSAWTSTTLGEKLRFDRCTQERLSSPNCIRDLQSQVAGNQSFTARNMLRPSLYFKHQNLHGPPDQASWVRQGRRNQWHFKPHQTWEKDMGLQPGFLWRCSRSRWKQGFEESLCSGGDTHGPESKWLIFKHAYEKSACVCAQLRMFSLMSLQVRVKYSLLDAVLCALECGRASPLARSRNSTQARY